jgi:hypothetical protein
VSEREMSDRSGGGGGAFNFPSAVHEANTAYACWAVARSVGGGQGRVGFSAASWRFEYLTACKTSGLRVFLRLQRMNGLW